MTLPLGWGATDFTTDVPAKRVGDVIQAGIGFHHSIEQPRAAGASPRSSLFSPSIKQPRAAEAPPKSFTYGSEFPFQLHPYRQQTEQA